MNVEQNPGPAVIRPVFVDPRGHRRIWVRLAAALAATGAVAYIGGVAVLVGGTQPPMDPADAPAVLPDIGPDDELPPGFQVADAAPQPPVADLLQAVTPGPDGMVPLPLAGPLALPGMPGPLPLAPGVPGAAASGAIVPGGAPPQAVAPAPPRSQATAPPVVTRPNPPAGTQPPPAANPPANPPAQNPPAQNPDPPVVEQPPAEQPPAQPEPAEPVAPAQPAPESSDGTTLVLVPGVSLTVPPG